MTRDPALEAIREALNPRRSSRAWHGGPTPLGALRGVTAEAAPWQVPRDPTGAAWRADHTGQIQLLNRLRESRKGR